MLTPRHQMRIRTQRMRLLDEQAQRTAQLPASQPLSCLPAPVVPVALWRDMLWCLAVPLQQMLADARAAFDTPNMSPPETTEVPSATASSIPTQEP